jgi:predicted peptidase
MKVEQEDDSVSAGKCGKMVERKMEKKIMQTISMKYLIYLPKDYTWEKKWPLVLFLHGAGERGADLELVKKHGPPMQIARGKEFSFILVSPQCPEYLWWPNKNRELKEIIDDVCGKYTVDKDRIYITGLSMGGFGTFSMVMEYPDLFAAAVPICGGIRGEKGLDNLAKVPFWIFHGAKDKVVPAEMSKNAAELIESNGGYADLTVYEGVGHDSWTETYGNPKVYEWMLGKRRKKA